MFDKILVVFNDELYGLEEGNRLAEKVKRMTKGRKTKTTIPRFLYPSLYKDVKLVISIGGDRTFLKSASHIIEPDVYILGLNPQPYRSVGFLDNFKEADLGELEKVLQEDFRAIKRQRTAVKKNNLVYTPALNEVLFGVDHWGESAVTYTLEYSRSKERQRTTGVIVATGTGSTGMYGSAGGEPFSYDSEFLRFLVRDPYRHGEFANQRILSGEIKKGEKITFVSETKYNCAIKQDGQKARVINPGDIVEVSLSDNPLNVIVRNL
jgi:NAD kinase